MSRIAALVLVTVGALAAGCGGAGSDAGAEGPIKVGSITCTAGPIDATVNAKAAALYFERNVNAKGGVKGRKVKFTFYDDGCVDPTKTRQLVRKLVEDDGVVALVGPFMPITWEGARAYLEREKIPVIGPDGVAVSQFTSPISFPLNQTSHAAGRSDATVAVEKLHAKRFGVIAAAGQDYAKQWTRGIREKAGESGAEVVSYTELGAAGSQSDLTGVVVRARQAGAEALLLRISEADNPRLVQAVRRQGWDVEIIGTPATMGQAVTKALGADAEGLIASSVFDVTPDNEIYQSFLQGMQKKHPETVLNPYGFSSYLAADLFTDIAGSLDEVTAESVLRAMNGLKSWESGVSVPVDFTRREEGPVCCAKYYRYEEGTWKPFTDRIQP